ncbi:hypothetical protein [Rhodococcus rhodnii]|uniref:Uncharacterized protein n=1 Tax=Rhodococcus rhodnii LMG 5362 TaxID=1273125 RepID=R7WN49_9NOCA|nr:hypothetical protein [Rhodococcus rhodnii]EOM76727.1 hypothetical protein Rrhod_1846 [Rhodococcus rhodnii LMG 5362]
MLRTQPEKTTVRELALRWAIIVALGLVAFWQTDVNIWQSMLAGTGVAYLFAVPLLCAVAAIGVAARRPPGLPIHDRQTDIIVGILVLLLSLGVQYLLIPRFRYYYLLLHLDHIALWLFVGGACILLFGLRATTSFWRVGLLALLLTPSLYVVAAALLGGGALGNGLVMALAAAFALAAGAARGWREGVAVFLVTFAAACAILVPLVIAFQPLALPIAQLVPSLTAAIAVGVFLFLWHRRGDIKVPLRRGIRPPSTSGVRRRVVVVAVAAVALAVAPLPTVSFPEPPPGPVWAGATTLAVPDGWTQQSITDYDWPRRYFGPGASFTRQGIVANEPSPAWDDQGRRREIKVDVLTVPVAGSLVVEPIQFTYDLQRARRSDALEVDIGHGITARMFTVVDDKLLLTWTTMYFTWIRDDRHAQRVSLVSVDNHDPGSPFPEPRPSQASLLRDSLSVLFRGTASIENETPVFKDGGMMQSVARSLVQEQPW